MCVFGREGGVDRGQGVGVVAGIDRGMTKGGTEPQTAPLFWLLLVSWSNTGSVAL